MEAPLERLLRISGGQSPSLELKYKTRGIEVKILNFKLKLVASIVDRLSRSQVEIGLPENDPSIYILVLFRFPIQAPRLHISFPAL